MTDVSALLEVENLKVHFPIRDGLFGQVSGHVRAVDGVSIRIRRGTTFGLVGESGSGKSTLGRAMLGLYKPTTGTVRFHGKDIQAGGRKALAALRPKMQLVFQDPYGSLNPRVRAGDAIGEALLTHGLVRKAELRDTVLEVMRICGLAPYQYARYPHEFSGGQRQRIGIARALALKPELIIADEPVSALDVSIQAQIINLFSDLKEQQGLTFLFISHDLAVVEHLCDEIAVMYLGVIVETASRNALFDQPRHPYTQALLSAIPVADPDVRHNRVVLQGELPSPASPPAGCRFHTRCPLAVDRCRIEVPELRTLDKGHHVACHLA
ncbi:dipeptide ABC transporter ATP-binding protein [Phyllobacterium sp. P30BS-XVII]|uniref:ABC transporter ATP-binding protein n=1 Tax=Phyllobacterium sp. P30BS-XVII TaxID=2587046 RepID=UPI0015FAE2F8|nr:dipeptide ABC transporter ATP-binding protein [Phyllobacterium sp. P30BS-XVII]MBA8902969.1 peptide/nickel transport system ATP-binding protein [Phyllobacterium sp. P30BS-XVII]